MTTRPLSLSGQTSFALYPPAAALLILAQHGYVWLAFRLAGKTLDTDTMFWLFPMRRLTELLTVDTVAVGVGFVVCLLCSLLLGLISFRRANWGGGGHALSLLTIVPTVQIAAAVMLSVMPGRAAEEGAPDRAPVPDWVADKALGQRQALIGLASGMTLIVGAVVVSANALGAYGWGLFVATPVLVGFTTGWAVNKDYPRSAGATIGYVMLAGLLGTLALLMLALEGFLCIVLIAPLAAVLAMVGGELGRLLALNILHPRNPMLSLAVLPLILLLDAAIPPQVPVAGREEIVIAARPEAVWRALTDGHEIASSPGVVGRAGLAYPIASRLTGEAEGALRIGQFSTGEARERVTVWQPGRLLAFRGESHAPAMEEMSPYRAVHSPHVSGYFDTLDTRFVLAELPNGSTRLSVTSRHILRIDPVAYWGPIAQWAIGQNMQRVLADIRDRAETATAHPTPA